MRVPTWPRSTPGWFTAVSETLDVLIVGCGRIAGGFDEGRAGPPLSHAGAYRAHGGFRLVACVEPDMARRNAFMAAWQVARGFATLEEVLASGLRFDIASLCTPTADHAVALERLLAARPRAVLCEKPVTGDLAASRRIVADFAAAGVPLAVNHMRRFDPRMRALKNEIAGGAWGAVRSVAGLYNKGVLNNGSHLVDLIHLLLGPLEPVAVAGVRQDGMPGDPTVDAVLQLGDGTPVHLIGADARDYAVFDLDIVAEAGLVTLCDSGFRLATRRTRPSPRFAGYRDLDDGTVEATGLDGAMVAAVTNLHDAVTGGAPLWSDGASALAAQETCETLRSMAA